MGLLVCGGHVVTDPRRAEAVVEDGAVYVEGTDIVEVGPAATLRSRHPGAEEIGSRQHLVIPGLVNGHHHGSGVTATQLGRVDDALEIWKLGAWGSRRVDPYLNTLYACVRQIASGVTTTLHFNGTEQPEQFEAEALDRLRAYNEAGLRVAFALEARDRHTFVYGDDEAFLRTLPAPLEQQLRSLGLHRYQKPEAYLASVERLHRQFATHPRIRIFLAPYAPQWCTDELLQAMVALARRLGTGMQLHCLETPYQQAFGPRVYGEPVIAHLHRLGLLGPGVSLAHGVWLTPGDLPVLRESGAAIIHNPSSNLRLKSGLAPVLGLLEAGVTVGLGTDGVGLNDDDDLLQDLRLCLNLHREPGLTGRVLSPHQALALATVHSARALGVEHGLLAPGRAADLVLLDLDAVRGVGPEGAVDPVTLLVARGTRAHVSTVVIGGRVVLREGRCLTVDAAALEERIREQLRRPLPPRGRELRAVVEALDPHVRKFFETWGPLPRWPTALEG